MSRRWTLRLGTDDLATLDALAEQVAGARY